MDIPLGYILVKEEQYQELIKENAELILHNEELSKMLKKYEQD